MNNLLKSEEIDSNVKICWKKERKKESKKERKKEIAPDLSGLISRTIIQLSRFKVSCNALLEK